MSTKFSSNEVQNDTLENIEIVQYLEAQNVQKYFDYKIEKPKNNSFQTIELLKKKQSSLSERLNKIFSQEEDTNRALPPQPYESGKKTFSDILSNNPKQDLKKQEIHKKADIASNSYILDYNNSNFKISPLKQSNKINIMSSSKPQQVYKNEFNLSCDSSNQIEQSKENNYNSQSERLSQKISYHLSSSKDERSNQKTIFNNRYNNQQQVLTIILEVPNGVDKIIIENEDEVPEKAKQFCIKHNYSLECVPQLITSINQQIKVLTNKKHQDSENNNLSDNEQNNINNQMNQLPSFQDSIFNKSITNNQSNQESIQQNNNYYKINSNKQDKFLNSEFLLKEQNQNERVNKFNTKDSQKENKNGIISQKQFYNIYDSHEEALSELYNKKQQELKSFFQVENKNNKSMNLDKVQNKNQSLNESLGQQNICQQMLSSKKTTKKWQRDVSASPNQQNEHQSMQSEQKRSISPLLDRPSVQLFKNDQQNNQFDISPAKLIKQDPSSSNVLKKENSQSNLMKNLRDQVKLQKAESSANLNKQQESKIQNLIETNAHHHNQKKQDLMGTQPKSESQDINELMPNSPISKANNQFQGSNQKQSSNNSMAFQFSQNSSCNDLFNNTQVIKKSSSALLMNKTQIQPIEEFQQKNAKNEDQKKKRSISPFSNQNTANIQNKNYYKNTVSQQNKINDKSKDNNKNRSRSPIQTTQLDRSISNPRKKSIENNNISKSKIIQISSNNLTCSNTPLQNKEKNHEHENNNNNNKKEGRSITPVKNATRTPNKEKIVSKTPTKDLQNNPKTPHQAKANEENGDNQFQPQISEQSKKLAVASRQKGVAIHERLYNEAKKELKKKEQWDLQLKKILNKNQNQTPNQKNKEGNQLAYFQLKSIHQNGKGGISKPKDYVIYQNNNSPFKPREPEISKGKKGEVSSERDENKIASQKYSKCNSQGLLFQAKEGQNSQLDSKSNNKQEIKQNNNLVNEVTLQKENNENQIDHDSLIKQQQELLSFYQNSSHNQSKQKQTEKIVNINLSNICRTQEDLGSNQQNNDHFKQDKILKTMPDGLIFQKKNVQTEREHIKVSPRYKTYDNQEAEEDFSNILQNSIINSQASSRRMSEQNQNQNRLETQLFQNQLKQLQLQEEMQNQFKGSKDQSIDNTYQSLQQNIAFDINKINTNSSYSQVKKSDQNYQCDEKIKRILEYIFLALDSDQDGQISTDSIDLSKLNTTILMLIQDVLIDVENLGGFVDFECFCSLVKRRAIEKQLLEYVFNDNNTSVCQVQEEIQQSNYTSSYFTKPNNNQKSQDYFNEYEKQAMEFLGKQKDNNTRISRALLTNESLTPDLFFEKKQEYFDIKEYQNKLDELQKKSNQYDFKIENKEEQHMSSRYQNLLETEEKYQQNNASPAFGSDSIFRIKK